MIDYVGIRAFNELQIKLCESGNVGMLDGRLVDRRVCPKAETMGDGTILKIMDALHDEIGESYRLEEVQFALEEESKVRKFNDLLEEINLLHHKISKVEAPYLKKINDTRFEMKFALNNLEKQLEVNEKLVPKMCPHTKTKKRFESTEGDYLNRGSHTTIWDCTGCGKEIDRKEVDTGHC